MKITKKGYKNKHKIDTEVFLKKKKTKKLNIEGIDVKMRLKKMKKNSKNIEKGFAMQEKITIKE